MLGLSIAQTPMWEDWRPTLQRAVVSGGESMVVAADPSLLGVVPPRPLTSMAAMVLAAIPVVMVEAALEVSLVAPSPPATTEEERETRLPASPGRGPHGSPSRSEPEVPLGDAIGPELERLPVAHEIEVGEIPSDGKAGDEVELPAPLQELVVVR